MELRTSLPGGNFSRRSQVSHSVGAKPQHQPCSHPCKCSGTWSIGLEPKVLVYYLFFSASSPSADREANHISSQPLNLPTTQKVSIKHYSSLLQVHHDPPTANTASRDSSLLDGARDRLGSLPTHSPTLAATQPLAARRRMRLEFYYLSLVCLPASSR